ncbi:uncharacterized protein LOC100502277 precursor [Zea mays]|uniref:Secreted protein n=1 Tax=Zea mays TaxID=4577 RepID=C4J9V6_MAIZE|nr:uncharacterized protein LOC100502277 precursor [Zea mays]ACR37956.1 unknown [Zea mays]|eukprot:NP_001183683.1 uncharacterized protein LOC100502277 precursor [Zea mays]
MAPISLAATSLLLLSPAAVFPALAQPSSSLRACSPASSRARETSLLTALPVCSAMVKPSLPWMPEFLCSFSWPPSSFRRAPISSAPPRASWDSPSRRSVPGRGRRTRPARIFAWSPAVYQYRGLARTRTVKIVPARTPWYPCSLLGRPSAASRPPSCSAASNLCRSSY